MKYAVLCSFILLAAYHASADTCATLRRAPSLAAFDLAAELELSTPVKVAIMCQLEKEYLKLISAQE